MLKINFRDIFRSLYLYIIILLASYNDFFLGVKLGSFAQNPIFFISTFFILFEIYIFLKFKRADFSEIDKNIITFIFYSFLISIIYVCYFVLSKETVSFQGTSYFVKMSSYLLSSIMLYATYRHSKYIFSNFSSYSIFVALTGVLLTEFIILIVEIITMPNAFGSLHFALPVPYYRVRLLASEASISGFYVPIIFAMSVFYAKKYDKKNIIFLMSLSFLLTYTAFSGSKGFFLSIAITFILFIINIFFQYKHKFRNMIILFSAITILPLALFAFVPLVNDKLNSSEEAVTFSTRFLDFITSFIGLLKYPFGSGFGVHQEVIQNSLEENANTLSLILGSNTDAKEIDGFSFNVYGLDNKNLLTFSMTTCGVLGIYLLYKLLRFFLERKFCNFTQLFVFIYVVVSLSLFITCGSNYLLPIYIAFVEVSCFFEYEKGLKHLV